MSLAGVTNNAHIKGAQEMAIKWTPSPPDGTDQLTIARYFNTVSIDYKSRQQCLGPSKTTTALVVASIMAPTTRQRDKLLIQFHLACNRVVSIAATSFKLSLSINEVSI